MKKIILLLPFLLTACFDYSDGDRVGVIQKLSKKGIFCKTWEGEMLLGGLKKQVNVSSDGKSTTTSMVANTFHFTVEDESLLPAVKAAMESGQPVTISYREELISFCRSDESYFVTAVK